jgi:hypothetical protein
VRFITVSLDNWVHEDSRREDAQFGLNSMQCAIEIRGWQVGTVMADNAA